MEKFAVEKKVDEKQIETHMKKHLSLLDEDEIEIKKLDEESVEDTIKVMRRCAFDVSEAEVRSIIIYGMSYGACVNRMLIGIGLSWPANLDYESKSIRDGEPNALYLEDPAVILSYEGRGIRRMMLQEREEEAIKRGYKYAIAYLYEDIPKGNIADMIGEAGSQLEKLFLSENYEFFRTEKGILTVKRL